MAIGHEAYSNFDDACATVITNMILTMKIAEIGKDFSKYMGWGNVENVPNRLGLTS